MIIIKLKENTFISKVAFRLIKSFKHKAVATTIGHTIHLHNISSRSFAYRDRFLRHEMQHAIQFATIKFFWLKYLLETLKSGYFKNKYEVEAEESKDKPFPKGYLVVGKDILIMSKSDFIGHVPTLEFLNYWYKTDFKTYPEIVLK